MIGQIISLSSFFSMQGYFCYITQRLSRRSKVDLYSLNLRFGDSAHIGDVSWITLPSRYLCRFFRCCFRDVLCSRNCCFPLQYYVDFRGFDLPSLVQICRDSCRVVSCIDPCFKVDFTLYFQYKMILGTLSEGGYSEKTVNSILSIYPVFIFF